MLMVIRRLVFIYNCDIWNVVGIAVRSYEIDINNRPMIIIVRAFLWCSDALLDRNRRDSMCRPL